jgi:uncharacterized membrane protein YtjA (UPF0391 family)
MRSADRVRAMHAVSYTLALKSGTAFAVGWVVKPGWVVSRRLARDTKRRSNMLHYAAVFFVIAIVAALFGFGGIAAGAAEIAKVLFFIFLVLFVVSLVAGLFRRGR